MSSLFLKASISKEKMLVGSTLAGITYVKTILATIAGQSIKVCQSVQCALCIPSHKRTALVLLHFIWGATALQFFSFPAHKNTRLMSISM